MTTMRQKLIAAADKVHTVCPAYNTVDNWPDVLDAFLSELARPDLPMIHACRPLIDQYTTPPDVYLRAFTAMINHVKEGR